MTDTERFNQIEARLQSLTKRVEDLELDMDQPRAAKSAGLINEDVFNGMKQRLVSYIQDKPLPAMGIAILATAFIVLLLK